jgi:hypothetical protein
MVTTAEFAASNTFCSIFKSLSNNHSYKKAKEKCFDRSWKISKNVIDSKTCEMYQVY